MALDYTKKTSRRGVPFMDVFHVTVSVAIIVLFIITAIDFDKNRRLIPFIMLGVAIMNGGDAIYQIQHLPHGRKNFGGVILSTVLCLFFLAIGMFMWIVYFW